MFHVLKGDPTPMPRPPEAIVHGGDLDAARAAFPVAPEPWIDLSTGINPDPYPVREQDHTGWTRLPQSTQEQGLREAAACRYGADHSEMVVAAPGTQALIQVIPRLLAPSRVAILSPTYAEHAAAWRREKHDVVEVADLSETASARVVVVVNPNNPTGLVTPASELRHLSSSLQAQGGFLVVDEAFADIMPAEMSIIPALPRAAIVLRSFGKTYGLPGLRLGFAVTNVEVATRLRDLLGPWSVSVPAMAVGTAALADDHWLKATAEKLERAGSRLDALLEDCGCSVIGRTPLFRLASHRAAPAIAESLGRSGILVRRFRERDCWLRFGLPRCEEEWWRLELALNGTRTAPMQADKLQTP